MLKILPVSILVALLCQGSAASGWIDRSPTIFLPPQLSAQLESQQSFPIFWWNFLILEFQDEETGFTKAGQICDVLQTQLGALISKSGCRQDLDQFKPIVADWAKDHFLRHKSPSAEVFTQRLNTALAKASLPTGAAILAILRMDPLETYKDLQKLVEERLHFKFKKKAGYLIDEEAKRIVIPVQFSFPPFATEKTKKFLSLFEPKFADSLRLMGSHASTIENEAQVNSDLGVVSITGTLLLMVLGFAVLFWRRWQLLLIVPPVLVSTVLSAILTIAIFGSIHGLTLAFGSGIIGVAIDFGLHSIFNRNYPGIWKANAFGLYTTVVALIVMMFSSIPLLQQIMAFSTLGITSGYLILWVLDHVLPKLFNAKPFDIKPKNTRLRFALSAFLVLCAVAAFGTLNLSLDISQFDFQTAKNKEVNRWLFKNLDSKAPLMQVYASTKSESALEIAHRHKAWAEKNGVHYEGVANYLPTQNEQKRNFETWSKLLCSNLNQLVTPVQQKLFEPFVTQIPCGQRETLSLNKDGEVTPTYVRDFKSVDGTNRWISLWLPQSEEAIGHTKEAFPGSLSLKEVVSIFPLTLFRELKWMVPISFLLTLLLLAFYYKKIYPALLCMIPFFSGLGLFALAAFLFNYNTSFITIIGMVMVFGLSVDYGIFATDLSIGKKRSVPGVWSALALSALTATMGFAPLIFCKHPVLLQLGQPLVFGTIGTYIGTVWGIPGCVKFLKRFKVKPDE